MNKIRKIVRWFLFIVSGLLILSGYGITQYQTVEKLTLGFLSKSQFFQLHEFLAVLFIILLFAHIILATKILNQK